MSEIGTGTKVSMHAVAGVVSFFQGAILWIPLGIGFVLGMFLTPIISLCLIIVFWLWFKSHGVNIFSPKALAVTLISIVLGLLGVFAFIPGFNGFLHSMFKLAKAESENEA
jgi:hypothetical protein